MKIVVCESCAGMGRHERRGFRNDPAEHFSCSKCNGHGRLKETVSITLEPLSDSDVSFSLRLRAQEQLGDNSNA